MRILSPWGMERGILWISVILVSFSFLVSFSDSVLEGQDSRRLAPSTKIGCTYRDGRYEHGEPVQTPEPCLNCTCTRGVLVCYLRVCPTLVPPSSDCFAVKEADDCCATMICNNIHRVKTNESSVAKTNFYGRTLTNNVPIYKKSEIVHISNNHRASTKLPVTTSTEATTTNLPETTVESIYNESAIGNLTPSESLLFVSSTPFPFEKDIDVLFNSITGCYVNGTIYAEGSAMISSSFCEYCYCIRGKQMCVRPKCHLSIEGCSPRYFSKYTCCPTRYMCNEKRKIYRITSSTTTTTTTTIKPVTLSASTVQHSGCVVEGIRYSGGDPIPSTAHCQTCYCSKKGIVCTSVTCSPAMEGCEPVILEGHCCPLEFKCNFTQTPPSDVQVSTFEMIGNKNMVNSHSLETIVTPLSVQNANKTREELKEILKPTQSVEPETIIDSSILSPAIMRENDRVIYFPEFAGNLRRRISEAASGLGYNTKQSNKGPFHSFRPPVIYKRNNERGGYFSKQGLGLIPRQAAGRGRADFGPEEVEFAETDTELLAASANLHITDTEFVTRDFPSQSSFSAVYSTTTQNSVTISNDLGQNLTNANILTSEDIPEESTTIAVSPAILEKLTYTESFKSVLSNTSLTPDNTTFQKLENITIDNVPGTYSNETETSSSTAVSASETSLQHKREHTDETILMTDNHNVTFTLQQEIINSAEFLTTELSFATNLPLSDEISLNTESSLLDEYMPANSTSTELYNDSSSLLESDSSSNISLTIINTTEDSTSTDGYDNSTNSILTEDNNLIMTTTLTTSVEDKESKTETSKGIWYSEPGLTTLTLSDARTLSSSKLDSKKRPRQKEEKPHFENNMRIIPFLAKDAITNRPYAWPIRNRTQAATQSTAEVIIGHCTVNGRVYINGEMIANSDPCSLCRCFYGKALCQQQQCPSPPSSDCIPEQLAEFCCPRYICGKGLTDAPISPTFPTITDDKFTSQDEFSFKMSSTEPASQYKHHAEESLKINTTPLTASSTSHDVASIRNGEEDIHINKKFPLIFDLDNISPITSSSGIVVTTNTVPESNSKSTEEHLDDRLFSTTESLEFHPEGIKSEFWALLRVSGCNIYGQYYQLNERVTELSGECKDCMCTKEGVKCNEIC